MWPWRHRRGGVCGCGALERLAADPENPLRFDPKLNEYQITYGPEAQAYLVVHFCFVCGGAAPPTSRGALFAPVAIAEVERLTALTQGITSLEAALSKLGTPDVDLPAGEVHRGPVVSEGGEELRPVRILEYTKLSATAVVRLTVSHTGVVTGVRLNGKVVGPGPYGASSNR